MKPTIALFFLTVFARSLGAPLESLQVGENDDGANKLDVGEYGKHYQGDMVLPRKRNGEASSRYRWPNGVVPYVLSSAIGSNERAKLQQAFEYYKTKTCTTWVPRSGQRDYILFTADKDDGCWAHVGKHGGKQTINLAPSCFNSFGTIVHEMMHALGFYHEQAREDRDQYVTIHWENIRDDAKDEFNIEKGTITFGAKYDITSVMQYGPKAWSKNGKYTITPKNGSPSDFGPRESLSNTDIFKIQAMYKCKNTGGGSWTTPQPGKVSNIKTRGGNAGGKPCVFPFVYGGFTYNQCTDVDEDELWCATTPNYDVDSEYGFCILNGGGSVNTKKPTSTKVSNIKTTGGNAGGKRCVFPFIYNGKSYSKCTDVDEDDFWCATTPSYDDDQEYGFCILTGGSVTTKTSTSGKVLTKGGNSNGAPCVFPFVYRNKTYKKCTTVNDDKPWCATTSDYKKDRKYGYCV